MKTSAPEFKNVNLVENRSNGQVLLYVHVEFMTQSSKYIFSQCVKKNK